MTQQTTFNIADADIETLQKSYIIRGKYEVFGFIETHPYLLPVLLEAPEKIRRYFPDEKLGLRVVHDPEIVNYVHLVLSIDLTNLDPSEAMDREDQLRENWWFGVRFEVWEKLGILLEQVSEL